MVHIIFIVVATVLFCSGGCNAFITPPPIKVSFSRCPSSSTLMLSSPPENETPANLVSQEAFVKAIDILKEAMGMEIIPDDQRPLYAIGKLVAQLPLELVSGIRFADCETLTLISQLKQSVVDETGMQSLDTSKCRVIQVPSFVLMMIHKTYTQCS